MADSLILSLAFVDTDEGYAGTNSGVFETSNGGDDWTKINRELPDLPVQSIAVVDHAVAYAGTYCIADFSIAAVFSNG